LSAEIAEKQARSIKYQLTIAKLPLAKRCYGASGEDKASSSLETTDGVPHAAVDRPEQIARRSGSG
jgi:hypothetical protein